MKTPPTQTVGNRPMASKYLFAALTTASLTLASLQAREMPPDVWTAQSQMVPRLDNIAFAFAQKYVSDVLAAKPLESHQSSTMGLRKIASILHCYRSGLITYEMDQAIGGRGHFITYVALPYFNSIYAYKDVGTDGDDGSLKKDYDMYLKDQLTFWMGFLHEPQLLTNQMIFKLICQASVSKSPQHGGCIDNSTSSNPNANPSGVASWSGQVPDDTQYLGYWSGNYPETENHVLMINSWKYLVNAYVMWVASLPTNHYRYDSRIVHLYNQKDGIGIQHYNNQGGNRVLEDFILQILGRPLHNGMFEQNAKAYESFSLHAMMNLYMGANSLGSMSKVKAAAQNAVDFLAIKFAFQSLEGKRMTATRRNWSYKERRGFYNNDYLPEMFGMLSGAYLFNDAWNDPSSRYHYTKIGGSEIDQGQAFALWSGLFWGYSDYFLPSTIHDFMLNKRSGHFTRMLTYFTKNHYIKNAQPKYFVNGSAYKTGEFSSTPEFYFATPTFLNASGGFFRNYYSVGWTGAVNDDAGSAQRVYHFATKPNALITRGDIGQNWGTTGTDYAAMTQEILTMKGHWSAPGESRNLWTYKNFTYGYTWEKNVSSNYHTYWPAQNTTPPSWAGLVTPQQMSGRGKFKVYDLRNLEVGKGTPAGTKHGFYVVMGQFSKSSSDPDFWNYARGIWEIVPGHLFTSKESLLNQVIANNPATWYNDNTGSHYNYKLATSGETLKLDNKVGTSQSCQSIMEIKNAAGAVVPLNSVLINNCSGSDILANAPLLEAKEVDANFNFTGRVLAYARGDGRVVVDNPYLGTRLELNSTDYKNPWRSGY